MSDLFDERDQHFLKWREANPGKSYAQYQTGNGLRSLERGDDHATLGPKLRKYPNWWEAGTRTFERLRGLSGLREDSKVLDYGCGSLRIGGHFVRHLQPEHYFGIDVTDGFYEMGKELIGAEMMADKRPRFAVIGEESLNDGVAFGADVVISSAVSYHVHPTETAIYYGNLQRLTCKPGARLLFDASISDVPLRNKSWCWPLDFYVQSLPELKFLGMDGGRAREDGTNFAMGVLQFERAP